MNYRQLNFEIELTSGVSRLLQGQAEKKVEELNDDGRSDEGLKVLHDVIKVAEVAQARISLMEEAGAEGDLEKAIRVLKGRYDGILYSAMVEKCHFSQPMPEQEFSDAALALDLAKGTMRVAIIDKRPELSSVTTTSYPYPGRRQRGLRGHHSQ